MFADWSVQAMRRRRRMKGEGSRWKEEGQGEVEWEVGRGVACEVGGEAGEDGEDERVAGEPAQHAPQDGAELGAASSGRGALCTAEREEREQGGVDEQVVQRHDDEQLAHVARAAAVERAHHGETEPEVVRRDGEESKHGAVEDLGPGVSGARGDQHADADAAGEVGGRVVERELEAAAVGVRLAHQVDEFELARAAALGEEGCRR